MTGSTFLLIHGAFRGGWSWSRVAPLLAAEGHVVLAPSLRGAGERSGDDDARLGLGDLVADLVTFVEMHDLTDVILAGHSQGGMIARAASQHLAPRLRMLAMIDAAVPAPGETAFDLMSSLHPDAPAPPRDLRIAPWAHPDPWTAERLRPEWSNVGLDPLVLDDPAALGLEQRFLFCTQTPATYPCAATRARLDAAGTAVDVIDADHDAPLTDPTAVAGWLLTLVDL